MKKSFFFILGLACAVSGISQNRPSGAAEGIIVPGPQSLNTTLVCDTVSNLNLTSDTAAVYPNTGTGLWGYVSGHNSYKDKSKAEKFFAADYTAGYQLAGGIFYFYKATADSGSTILLAAWDDNGTNGYPSTLLMLEQLQVAGLQTGMNANMLMFTNPQPVSGDFYFGISGLEYTSPQKDTVVLYTGTKYASTNTAYEEWLDGTWHAFSETNNWNLKLHFFMAAILCNTEVGTYEILNHSDEVVVFPNPAAGEIYVNAGTSHSDVRSIEIFDAAGKKVATQNISAGATGTIKINADLSNGLYTLRIISSSGVVTKKIIVNR